VNLHLRGVLVPLIIRVGEVGHIILDGWCRSLAAAKAGLEKVPCIVTTQKLDPGQILAMQMATAIHRAELSGFEKWQACARLRQLNPTWQQKDIAANLSLSESMIVRLVSPSRCIPAWQQALKEGKVGVSDCYQASLLEDAQQQEGLLNLKLSGASRNEIAGHGRRVRKGGGDTPTATLSKAKLALVSGVSIVVSGPDLTLNDLIDSLGEAAKEAKKTRDQGLDIRTMQAVFKDKAKKGTEA